MTKINNMLNMSKIIVEKLGYGLNFQHLNGLITLIYSMMKTKVSNKSSELTSILLSHFGAKDEFSPNRVLWHIYLNMERIEYHLRIRDNF